MSVPAPERKSPGRILVVEDEQLIREMLIEILQQADHAVTGAADGNEALELVEKQEFDLVISDLHLPGINGMDLLDRIKASHPTLPFIVITGHPALDKAIQAMKKGAADFIPKPFTVEHILHLVEKNLKERRLYAENQRLVAELNNKAVIEKLNAQLHAKVEQLTKLYSISESFHSYVDNDSLLQYVVDLASDLIDAQRISLLTFDKDRRYLVARASRGLATDVQRKICLKVGEGVAGRVAQSFRPIRVTTDDLQRIVTSEDRSYLTRSWLSVPLSIGGELFGVLNMTDKRDGSDFTEEDEYLAMVLAEKAGIKIENNVLYEGIYSNLIDTLKTLVSTIEAKDAYTRHHSQRVTEVALAVARRVGCSEEDCESISFAGILHDIGKIGIRDSILQKTSRLTGEEYEVIKTHPSRGDAIIEPLGLIDSERRIIRHHHERLDGRGYPDGLKGDEIPYLTRIVSIADAFDAMTSTRSYRQALEVSVVASELRKNSGAQFAPDLVDAMLELIESGEVRPFENESAVEGTSVETA
jgi:putative nucleotidyltransferase with HDIG domain